METDQYHQLERGAAVDPQFGDCGQDQDVGVCRPNIGTGSLKTGVHRDPATGIVTFFTLCLLLLPLLRIVTSWAYHCEFPYPDGCKTLKGFNQCAVARPTIPGFARHGLRYARQHWPGLIPWTAPVYVESVAREELRITERYFGGVPHGRQQHLQPPGHGFNYTQGNTCIDCAGSPRPL